jgi:hypothetical protein
LFRRKTKLTNSFCRLVAKDVKVSLNVLYVKI